MALITVKQLVRQNRTRYVQKRSMRIIYPELSYNAVVDQAKCSSLHAIRDLMCTRTFEKIRQPSSRLNNLIPPSRETGHNCNQNGLTFGIEKQLTKSVQHLPKLFVNNRLVPRIEMGESFRY